MQTVSGQALAVANLRVLDALMILLAGDDPAPEFLPSCRHALERNATMGFAGTWARDCRGQLFDDCFDVTPERYPFERGARLTRALIRTSPGEILVDLHEAQAGIYGETGALWRAEEKWGRGCLLPRALLQTSSIEVDSRNPGQLAFLVQAVASVARRERIAMVALSADSIARRSSPERPSSVRLQTRPVDHRAVGLLASEYLNGTTLARLAWVKFRRKILSYIAARIPDHQNNKKKS